MGIRNEPEHRTEPLAATPELEASAAPAVTHGPLSVARVQALQRSAGNAAVTALLREPAAAATAPPAAGSLIAEDDAAELRPGRTRRREFLSELRAQVDAVLDEVVQGVLLRLAAQATASRWFADAAARTAPELERAILDFVPAATGAASARGYIPPILARVRREARASGARSRRRRRSTPGSRPRPAPAARPPRPSARPAGAPGRRSCTSTSTRSRTPRGTAPSRPAAAS